MSGSQRFTAGPWLWGPSTDLLVFGGSVVVALGVVLVGRATGLSALPMPGWAWLVFVLGVDVAHVWSTIFRTYLDASELRAHPLRYLVMPLCLYAAMVTLHLDGALTFWRVLAYVAVFHFVRQQVGWVAIYRARSPEGAGRGAVDRLVDDGAVYVATLYPIFYWHATLHEKPFSWFITGDFVDVATMLSPAVPWVRILWVACLAAFLMRQLRNAIVTRSVAVGKLLVVLGTALIWYIGIVATRSDFEFTVTNVVAHGAPYVVLLWFYGRERARAIPDSALATVVRGGGVAFIALILLLAFVEELLWDRLVWGDRPWLFGDGAEPLNAQWLAFVVPLLSLPQVTHYALDGLLWRRGETQRLPAQRVALGGRP